MSQLEDDIDSLLKTHASKEYQESQRIRNRTIRKNALERWIESHKLEIIRCTKGIYLLPKGYSPVPLEQGRMAAVERLIGCEFEYDAIMKQIEDETQAEWITKHNLDIGKGEPI